jgi:hypothetical protein
VVSNFGRRAGNTLSAIQAATAGKLVFVRARETFAHTANVIENLPVPRVLAGLVVLEWLAVLATARVVRHAGWIYYQGGDQLWYYTLGWLLGHGQLTQTLVGYGWSAMLAPIARVAGPNLVSALPAIALLNVLVLLPAAMLALYGIAARIGGRLFGYWAVALWLVVPFAGVLYTNTGYHQRYTELLLPQAFGLTAMADFPAMVATVVSIYFCVRSLWSEQATLLDGIAAGVAAGAAIAIKPSAALFLAGPALAFAYRRRFKLAGAMLVGLAPAVGALTVWKERGLGQIPVLSQGAGRLAGHGLAAGAPLAGLDFGKYYHLLNWAQLGHNIDLLREHFWSGRLIVWLVIAGLIGLGRRSLTAFALVGGWFLAFAIVKGSYASASIEDGSLFRVMMPSYPAFVLVLASVPLLLPGAPQKLRTWRAAFAEPRPRVRWSLAGAALLLTAIVPLAAIAAVRTTGQIDRATAGKTVMPVPANVDVGLAASVQDRHVILTWRPDGLSGGPVFYRIWRGRTGGTTCPQHLGALLCGVDAPEVGTTHANRFDDRAPRGRWVYRLAIAANWLNDPNYGDVYVLSRPVVVHVR